MFKASNPARRRLRWFAAVLVAIIMVTVAIFVMPTYLARWVFDAKLEDFGLQASGIETVDIDLWDSKIRFGPLTIGAPGAKPARLEQFGIKYSFSRLFDRRGLGKETVVEGLILDVARDAKGRISVNGVDIFALLQPTAAAPPPEAADSQDQWGAGLQRFLLRDSRIRFRRHDGGELELEIDRLALDGFRTWAPDTPGRFALTARLNGMAVQLDGEAKPFSDRIEVQATSTLSAIELSKVQRFTGRLPLTRGDGTMRASLKHHAVVAPDGTIQLSDAGDISVDGLSISLPDGPDIAFANAVIVLNTAKVFRPDGSIDLSGSLNIEGKQARLGLPDGSVTDFDTTTMQLGDMKLTADADQTLTGNLSVALRAAEGKARREGRSLQFDALQVDATLADLALDASGSVRAIVDATLSVASPKADGPSHGNADRLAARLSKVKFSNAKGDFSAGGGLSLDLTGLTAESGEVAAAPSLSLKSGSLRIAEGQFDLQAPVSGALSWKARFGLNVREASAAVAGPHAGTVTFDQLQLEAGAIDETLRPTFDAVQIDAFSIDVENVSVDAAPPHPGRVAFDKFRLVAGVFDREARSTFGGFELDGLSLMAEGLLPSSVAGGNAGQLSVGIGEIRGEEAVREADGALSLRAFSLGEIETTVRGQFDADARLNGLKAQNVSLSAETRAGAEKAVLSGFDLAVGGGEALKLQFGSLTLDALSGSAAPALEIGAVVLQGLDIAASSALLPADEGTAPVSTDKTGDAPARPQISIGRFKLADPAQIVLTDKRQSPTVKLDTKVNRFELRDFDTKKPGTKSALTIAATINEFTDLSLEGWVNVANEKPSVDLKTAFKNLELPPFSRYAATYLGVNLESGRLSAQADGKVIDGTLDAATKLNILNLKFSPLSPKDAKRLSAATGVPIETAVGLLEGKDGRIELSIPVKGDLENPNFDLDQVIGKAVGNAIVATIGTTLQVLFPPALLISVFDSATSGSGVEFAPAPFEAGTVALEPKGRELVDALAKLLKDRPKLTVTLCGRATADDLNAALKPEVEAILAERRAAYAQALSAYQARLRPLVEQGIVNKDGVPLAKNASKSLPLPPAKPDLDAAALMAERGATRADELRDSLTTLAAERTKTIRRDLAERLNVSGGQVAECRSVFDSKDAGAPRAEIKL